MFYVLHSVAIILLSAISFLVGYSVAEDSFARRYLKAKKEK